MNWIELFGIHRSALIDRSSGNVKHATHDGLTNRHRDWFAAVRHLKAALEAFGSGHRDGAHRPVPDMLLHFESDLDRFILNFVIDIQGVVDRRQGVGELDIHNRTGDSNDFAFVHMRTWFNRYLCQPAWPPAMSSNSFVMFPWRSLLYSSFKSLIRVSALSVAFFIETMRALCSLALALSRT